MGSRRGPGEAILTRTPGGAIPGPTPDRREVGRACGPPSLPSYSYRSECWQLWNWPKNSRMEVDRESSFSR